MVYTSPGRPLHLRSRKILSHLRHRQPSSTAPHGAPRAKPFVSYSNFEFLLLIFFFSARGWRAPAISSPLAMGHQQHGGTGLWRGTPSPRYRPVPPGQDRRQARPTGDAGLHGHHTRHPLPALTAGQRFRGRIPKRARSAQESLRLQVDAAVYLGFVQTHVLGAKGDVFVAGLLKRLFGYWNTSPVKSQIRIFSQDAHRSRPSMKIFFAAWWAYSEATFMWVMRGAFARSRSPVMPTKCCLFTVKLTSSSAGHCGGQAGVIDASSRRCCLTGLSADPERPLTQQLPRQRLCAGTRSR